MPESKVSGPRIYLDHNATTAPDIAVVEALLPFLREQFHNPSSPYPAAALVADAVEHARLQVARLLGTRRSRGVVFTSGGSESINAALYSAAKARPEAPRVISSSIEHSATKGILEALEQDGREWVQVPVDGEGRLDHERLISAIDGETALVSLMLANNETGVITDLEGVADACRAAGALLHIDAVQGPGKLVLDVQALGADLVSLAAHKFHGPKGVGALWVRPGLELEALVRGGPQESGRRAGTENVPGIVGMGVAAELARERAADSALIEAIAARRDRLETGVLAAVPGASAHGTGAPRVANTTNLHLPGADATALLLLLAEAGVDASAGSACNAQATAPSPVLLAMGCDSSEASCSLRFSLGPQTTDEEVERALKAIVEAAQVLATLA